MRIREVAIGIAVLGLARTLSIAAEVPHPACAPSEEVEAILAEHYEGGSEERAPVVLEALASHPNDVHLNRALQDGARDGAAILERYRGEAAARPGDPMALYLYGRLLDRNEDPEAEKVLLSALEVDPTYPWAHFALAHFYETVRKDAVKAQAHLRSAIDSCPNSTVILGRLGDLTSAEIARRAEVARAALAKGADPTLAVQLRALWAAEFETRPPAEHAAIRERMRRDLELLRASNGVEDRRVFDALLEGYRMVGDDAGLDWAIAETARRFPDDDGARIAAFRRFAERHPRPEDCDSATRSIHDRQLADAAVRWVALWPRDPSVHLARLRGLAGSSDVPSEELTAVIDAFVAAAAARPSPVPRTPIAFEAAQVLMERNRALDRVPAMIEQGLAEIRARSLGPPAVDDPHRTAQGLAILVELRLRQDDLDAARAAFAELERVVPVDLERSGLDSSHEARFRKNMAIDLVARTRIGLRCGTEDDWEMTGLRLAEILAPDLAAVMSAHRASMPERPPVDLSFGKKKAQPLPEFELQDLSGRTWRPADLRGKVVLIHAWIDMARMLLPSIQVLSARLAERPDVVVLTINGFDNPGKIAPILEDNGYTFPVVFSKDLFGQLAEARQGFPTTWIVDRQGVVVREDSGFAGGGEPWIEAVLRAIEEVGAGAPAPPGKP